MNRIIVIAGTAAGILGLVLCFISSVLRLSGMWFLGSFDLMTIFTVGVGLMVAACFLKLHFADSQ